jgi:CDP-paratose 2-epimerase
LEDPDLKLENSWAWRSIPAWLIQTWHGKQVREVFLIQDRLELLDVQLKQIHQFRAEVFNAGGGGANSISLCEATKIMQEMAGRCTSVTDSDQLRKGDIVLYWTDNRKVANQLGWKPSTDLRSGFAVIFEWIRENEPELRSRYCS